MLQYFYIIKGCSGMRIQESGENYLEAILIIINEKGYAKAIDISKKLKVSKPSVSRAISILNKAGYIILDEHKNISLSKEGLNLARSVYDRHLFLTKFFESIGVSRKTAEIDACRVEHVLSNETLSKLKKNYNKSIKN